MKKRIFSLIMVFCMALSFCSVTAFAADGETTSPFPEAKDGVITLTGNVELTSPYEITMDTTIDLAGYTITGNNVRALIVKSGTLTLTGTGTVTTVAAETNPINRTSSVIFVGDDVNEGVGAAKLVIDSDVTIAAPATCGVTVFGKNSGLTLDVRGTVEATGTMQAISGNGSAGYSSTTINIYEGAKVTSKKIAMYLPQSGTVNIYGGTIEGYAGIGIKSGTLNITGGTIKGTENDTELYDSHSTTGGITYDGSAIVIDSYTGYAGQMNITISGEASIQSTYSTAIREIGKDSGVTNVINLKIEGGTITGGTNMDAVLVREVSAEHVSITGGTFSSDPTAYVAESYGVVAANGTYTVVEKTAENAVASITSGDSTKYYLTLADAVGAAQNGDTVMLLKDCSGGGIALWNGDQKSITIDLNQHTYTVAGNLVGSANTATQAFHLEKENTVTIKNGTLTTTADSGCRMLIQNYSNLTLTDVEIDGTHLSGSASYVVSNNYGTVKLDGSTSIYAPEGWFALDSCGASGSWSGDTYAPGAVVTVNTTGEITGKVESCSTLKIENGCFTKSIGIASCITPANPNAVEITGGYFTIDPSAYVAEGYAAVESDKAGYTYMVTEKSEETVVVKPATGETNVSEAVDEAATAIAESVTMDDTAGLTDAAQNIEIDGAGTIEAAKKIEDAPESIKDGSDLIVYKQVYLAIESGSYTEATDGTPATLTLEISPMMQLVVSTADKADDIVLETDNASDTVNAVKVGDPQKLTVTNPVTISFTVPSGMTATENKLYVRHKGYEYTATVATTGTNGSATSTATFTNPHGFSEFVVSTSSTAVAKFDGTSYTNFQDAVNAALADAKTADGAAITILDTASSLTANVSGYGTFKFTLENSAGDTVTTNVSINGNEPDENGVISFTYTAPGGILGESTLYTVSAPADVTGGNVSVSPSQAGYGTTVTITISPDDGYELDALTVTDSSGNEVKLTKVSDTKYTFEMPHSQVTVKATFVEIEKEPTGLSFIDVPAGAYYYDAVYWAVEQGVTNGTSTTTFSPDMACTRAQMVTFLWRAAGSPELTSTTNPFTDVSSSAYYYDAVLWAVEQGVTNGTSATTFSPDMACTRAQMVTFLWRAAGSPEPTSTTNPFADVSSSAYYYDAVIWAVEQGITNGTGATTFSPEADCTRTQIVTLLYRYLAE